ncbi:MAG: AI-2E family transporter [bacterium]|nr:AI-2E family transporter [bacterium]
MLSKETLKVSKIVAVGFLTAAGLALLLWSLWFLRELVLVFLSAYLLMLALQKPIRKLIKWTHLPKPAAVAIVYVLTLVVSIVLVSLILPALITELSNLFRQIDMSTLAPGLAEELSAFNYSLSEISEIFSRFASSFGAVFKVIGNTFSVLFMGVTLFVVSIHLSMEHNNFYKKIYWVTKNEDKVVKVQKFFLMMEKELGGWISGQVLLMIIMGCLVGIGLQLIGVPYALPLGILAGMLEIVPNIGPIVAAVPAITLAIIYGGWPMAIWTTVFSAVIQQLENVLIVPTIMKNTADVSPIISILLILAGYQILGVIGALLAVPIYIAIRAIYSFWFKDKILNL